MDKVFFNWDGFWALAWKWIVSIAVSFLIGYLFGAVQGGL